MAARRPPRSAPAACRHKCANSSSANGDAASSNSFSATATSSYNGVSTYSSNDVQNGSWSSSGVDRQALYAAGYFAAGSAAYGSYVYQASGTAVSNAVQTEVMQGTAS